MPKRFSIVIPVYGNELNLPVTIPYIVEKLPLFSGYSVELILVCDGSPDRSYEIMKAYQKQYPSLIKIACFTRNFGQGAAVRCGMELATGDAVGVISCDMQDPFELFVDMLAKWEEGYKLVIARREARDERGWRVVASKLMHRLVHRFVSADYPEGGFDFYLLDREVVDTFCAIDAPNGSTQMAILWSGYPKCEIPYTRQERKLGKSGWKLGRKLDAAIGLFVTYSSGPVRMLDYMGILMGMIAALGLLICLIVHLFGKAVALLLPVVLFQMLFTGTILLAIGGLGEYLWRAFDLVKHRPRYVIREIVDEVEKQ